MSLRSSSVSSSGTPRTTRSRSRAAASRCHLLALSHDELGVIFDGLADPLQPAVAVALGGTCGGLRTPLRPALVVLEGQHERARVLCRKLRVDCASMRRVTALYIKSHDERARYIMSHDITGTDLETLTMILRTGGLPRLRTLDFEKCHQRKAPISEALQSFFQELDAGAMPSVTELNLHERWLGPAFGEKLAAALERGALRKLEQLYLGLNNLGNKGLAALAAPLRKLPALRDLYLFDNGIDDEGVASLVADADEDDFKTLEQLQLDGARLTDTGCATLIAAINRGALARIRGESWEAKQGLSVQNVPQPGSLLTMRYHNAVAEALTERDIERMRSKRPEAEQQAEQLRNARVELWWGGDSQWYKATVGSWWWVHKDTMHEAIGHLIIYDDGERKMHILQGDRSAEVWRPCLPAPAPA